jgi:8-oxo-dGTP pyrophosphatase MutT (NUDIX family)
MHRVPRGGGFWQGVTGAPLWDESDEQAAAREVREETGFEVEIEPLDFRYELHRKEEDAELWARLYEPGTKIIPEECYAAEVPPGSEPTVDRVEHDEYRWCSFEEAAGLLKWEENRRALSVLGERLNAFD